MLKNLSFQVQELVLFPSHPRKCGITIVYIISGKNTMKIKVRKSRVNGEITIPGSKSHSIRAVAVAAMAKGVSTINAPLISEDTLSCLAAAEAFGAGVEKKNGAWIIHGFNGKFRNPCKTIDMGNSGTSLRIFTGLAATADFKVSFDGDESLRTRPMHQLLDALRQLGVKTESEKGKCPVSVHGPIKGGSAEVNGQSSQFLSSLLFASPLALSDTELKIFNLNEKPYVEITLDWLRKQEIQFKCSEDFSWFKIKSGQSYKAFESTIPADFSTATFPLVAAALTGGKVNIRNLDFNDRQGDKEVFGYLKKMGAKIEKKPLWTTVTAEAQLSGTELDLNSTPDALPAMAVAASLSNGITKLLNVPQARIKETDRIACMTKELRKMGARITELPDGMIIEGGLLKGAELESYKDHRIVMSLAIAGLCAEGETIINDAEAAAVTYPDFINDFKKLGSDIEILN